MGTTPGRSEEPLFTRVGDERTPEVFTVGDYVDMSDRRDYATIGEVDGSVPFRHPVDTSHSDRLRDHLRSLPFIPRR